jgi:hypothetical protein
VVPTGRGKTTFVGAGAGAASLVPAALELEVDPGDAVAADFAGKNERGDDTAPAVAPRGGGKNDRGDEVDDGVAGFAPAIGRGNTETLGLLTGFSSPPGVVSWDSIVG